MSNWHRTVAVVAIALAATPAAADRRGEAICGEPPNEKLVVITLWTDSRGTQRWSASGPVQDLWTNYHELTDYERGKGFKTVQDKVAELVVHDSDIAEHRKDHSYVSKVPLARPCRTLIFTAGDRRMSAYVFPLGKPLEKGDYDARRNIP